MNEVVTQATNIPVRKVTAAGIGGSVATILVAAASMAGVTVGPVEAAAVATVLSFAFGWFRKAFKDQ